jgi:hypothetical protein
VSNSSDYLFHDFLTRKEYTSRWSLMRVFLFLLNLDLFFIKFRLECFSCSFFLIKISEVVSLKFFNNKLEIMNRVLTQGVNQP